MKNEHVEEEFYGDVVRLMNENVDSDMTIEKLDEVLHEASIKIPKKPLRNPTNTWDTDMELQNLLKKRDLISRSENQSEYKTLTRKVRKRAQYLRNVFLKEEGMKINLAWHNRELEKSYTLAKNQKMTETAKIGKKC